jgi:serine/threonine protein kinase
MSTRVDTSLAAAGYELGAVVRRPGLGAVHEARAPAGMPVWVWVLPRGGAVEPERFLDDARALAEARGKGLPSVIDSGEAPEGLYLVTEPVAAPSLEDLLARGDGLAPARVVRLLGEAADALDGAHAAGVLHRMLRPAALLVQDPPLERCHLADFALGLDRGFFRPDPDGLAYAAPEELRDRPATAASDRYSFACVAFEALTGVPPFTAESAEDLREAHLLSPPPRATAVRDDLPAAIDEAFEAGLSKNPAMRPETAGDLVAALARALLSAGAPSNGFRPPARPAAAVRDQPQPDANGKRSGALRRTLEVFGLVAARPEAPARRAPTGPAASAAADERSAGKPPTRSKPERDGSAKAALPAEQPRSAEPSRAPRAAPKPERRAERDMGRTTTQARGAPARSARRRRPVAVGAVVAFLACSGVAGWLYGQRGDEPAARAGGESASVRVDVPGGWSRLSAIPEIPGLELSGPVAARRGGATMVAGVLPAVVFPERVGRAVDGSAVDPETVRAGRVELYRWRGLRPSAGAEQMTLFATPTADGLAVLACIGRGAGECERAAGSLGVPGSEPASLDELAFYGTQVSQVLERMDARRAGGTASLRDAGGRAGQARVAGSLAAAHRQAARALSDLAVPDVAVDAHPELVAALRGVGGGYERLATALRRGDRRAYARAARLVERRERGLGRVVGAL